MSKGRSTNKHSILARRSRRVIHEGGEAESPGSLDNLRLVVEHLPEPASGEVLARIRAWSLNFRDGMLVRVTSRVSTAAYLCMPARFFTKARAGLTHVEGSTLTCAGVTACTAIVPLACLISPT
jgi:NADPH:quinone reductase-like Zn-dependent oxidoreductase